MQNSMIIDFDNVWAAYQIEPVLRNINWRWENNQQWALLGDNGAGKSALAQLITDKIRPTRGGITIDASIDPVKDIEHISFELQRKLIDHDVRYDDSETRADAFDVGTTVRQIVLQGNSPTERFNTIAQQCGIAHILDRGIRFVSTGESRKTLLARALYKQPKVLILDNPFEGLDKQSQIDLKRLINELLLSPLKILLLIKQPEEIPENITHIMQLDNGEILRQGDRAAIVDKLEAHTQRVVVNTLPPPLDRSFDIDRHKPLLELNGVNVSYNDQPILRDINWRLMWGQHCTIAGPNGAGKSTLLSLICGDNHKAYGQDISLFGQRRGSGESIWEIKEKFGIVSTALQLNHISRMRTAEVVASGLYDTVGLYDNCKGREKDIALAWLDVVGLKDLALKHFNQISFGQQRLVMLARAMVKSPLILILDEPCIGLDDRHRQHILALVDAIAARGDCHILYVSHTASESPACINQQLLLTPAQEGGYTATVS